MWIDKSEENKQLSEEMETAQRELKSTRRKLEEALVVRNYCICFRFMLNLNISNSKLESFVKHEHFKIHVKLERFNFFLSILSISK